MQALVVFESMFGNTEEIAKAVAEGIAPHMRVELTEVSDAPAPIGDDVGLLVVGGPTHAFGMSRQQTRQDAAKQSQHALVSPGDGVREWLASLEAVHAKVAAAAFDTHIDKPRVPGSAARAVHKRLRRLGFRVVVPAESFYVADSAGPLVPGEPERARRWAEQLVAELARDFVETH